MSEKPEFIPGVSTWRRASPPPQAPPSEPINMPPHAAAPTVAFTPVMEAAAAPPIIHHAQSVPMEPQGQPGLTEWEVLLPPVIGPAVTPEEREAFLRAHGVLPPQ